MIVKHYGFHTPPHGTIDMLKHIKFTQPPVVYIIDPLAGEELPYGELAELDKSNLFVIIQTGEGHSHRQFDILLDRLINESKVIANHITTYTGCLYDPETPINYIGTIVPHVGITLDMSGDTFTTVTPTHHYVCLNRYPRWQRYAIVEQLLDRELDKFGKISYGAGLTVERFQSMVKHDKSLAVADRYYNRLPMYLDGPVSLEQGYEINNNDIAGALFAVVTESSYEEHYLETPPFEFQTLPTLSEKTYKAFILGQIPIIVGSRYTVQCTREFGFDMFDDVIDHTIYDTEEDPIKRIQLIADQVEKICTMPVEELVALKEKLKPRLENNFKRLQYWAFNTRADIPRWSEYFNKLGVTDAG